MAGNQIQEAAGARLNPISMPRRRRSTTHADDPQSPTTAPDDAEPLRIPSSSASLYEVLGVQRTATHDEIRKAYHKLALRLHPDKNPNDQSAKEKFQSLQNVMAILGDPEKRKIYDETGSIEDAELSSETVRNLYEFFRTLFKKITEDDIEEFAASYKGSENEKQELINIYTKCKGNMDRVFDQLMCSEPEQDSHRLMDIINSCISSGELKEYDAYKKWAKKVAKKPRPPEESQRPRKKNRKTEGSEARLVALISNRRKQENHITSLAAALEAKYSGKNKPKKGKEQAAEPTEEEFEAARKRITERMKVKHKE